MTLLSIRAAAKLLHCDPRTLRYAIDHHGLPAQRFKKRLKIEKTALERWAAGQRPHERIVIPIPDTGNSSGEITFGFGGRK